MNTPKFLPWGFTACALMAGAFFFVNPKVAQGQKPEDIIKQAKKLIKDGNFYEAKDKVAPFLYKADPSVSAEAVAELMEIGYQALSRLGQPQELDAFLESTLKAHPENWRVLKQGSQWLLASGGHGSLVDGKFMRQRWDGQRANSADRDRVQALNWMHHAGELIVRDANTTAAQRAELFMSEANLWLQGRAAWQLQSLTDLKTLPEIEIVEGGRGLPYPGWGRGQGDTGYPSDADGNPVYFKLPATWEASSNDGERWRFLLKRAADTDAASAPRASLMFAQQLSAWLDVSTLRNSPVWPLILQRDEKAGQGDVNQSIVDLPSLKENETITRLATGIKRYTLPDEFNFMGLLKELSTGEGDEAYAALALRATVFENRRQRKQAAETWQAIVQRFDDKNRKAAANSRLDQIRGNWGKLEPQETQTAGDAARIAVVFRNAEAVSFTARPIKVDKLMERVRKDYRDLAGGKALKGKREWHWLTQVFSSILQGEHNIREDEIDKFLGDVMAEWKLDLQPAADHADRRVMTDSPLRDAGIYLVEAKFKDGNSTRAIVELVDLVSFLKPRLDTAGQWGFVSDANTGAPVANAEINAFGYRSDYLDRGNQPKQVWYVTEQHLRTDDKGGFTLGLDDQERHRWLLEVKAADGRTAVLGLQYYYWAAYNRNREDYEQQRVFVATDRPVYRPNQKVYLNAWARRATYKEGSSGNEYADRRFTVRIHDPRGEKLLEQQGSLDAEGAASVELSLAENATLGAYSIHWQIDNMQSAGSGSFRVEEYKKPEFEVTVKTPEKPILLGEAFKATIESKYYFGGAVTDAKVHYKVERTIHETSWFPVRPWDWLYGPGYWWRNYDYHWLNGYSKCITIAPPWWPRSFDPPEVVAEATVPIGPDGKLEIPLDSALAKELHGDKDHRYQITAEVVDSSRRMIVGTGSVVAPREPYKVYVWMDRGYYQPEAEANLSFTARTPDSQPVKGKARVKVYSVTYAENQEPKEEELGAFDLEVKDEQPGKQRLQFPKAGQYRLEVLFTDEAGHEVQGTAYTSVRGDADDKQNNGKDLRFPDLEVIAEKTEFQPGEEASFLINTDQEGATLLIFERPLNGAYSKPKQVTLSEGKSTNFKLKLDSEDQPNVFLEVVTVHHGKVHSQVVQVPIPPAKRIADVELTPSNETYKPQAEGNIQIKVTRPDGKPVEGRVLLTGYDKALEYISGGSNIPEIRDFFWGWKRHHNPQLISSLQTVRPYISQEGTQWQPIGVFGNNNLYFGGGFDDRSSVGIGGARSRGMILDFASPQSMAAAAPADGFALAPAEAPAARQMAKAEKKSMDAQSGGASAEAEPMIRQDFADLLIWNTMAKTDANGIASIPMKFPDDLTTWKLKAWVLGPNSEVGEAQVEVITRKDLLVRLQAPRFFVEKDEVVISGIVHNDHKDAQQVRAVLELDGKTLAPIDDADVEQRAEVKSHGEHRFDWRVKALAEGEAKIRIKALAAAESDAVEKTFPVFVHGMERLDAWSLAVSPDQAEGSVTFHVPDKRRPAQTRLEVRYSPSLAAAMVDALPFLISYPHGCTEQTLNRFVPTVITQSILKDLGLDLKAIRDKRNNLNAQQLGDPKRRAEQWRRWKDQEPVFNIEEMQKMVSAGIQRLQSMQSADGGWGWWPGASEGSAHITAQVVEGLLLAKATGTDVPQDVINAGLQWLERYESSQLQRLALPKENNQHKPWPDNIDALVHHILVTGGQGNDNMRKQLFEHRLKLSKATQARVGEACHLKGEADRRDMIVRNLEQYQKTDAENQTAWLDFGNDHHWWYWFDDEIETLASYLKLRLTRDAKDPIAPQLVKYLLNNRKNGSYWRSTRDTAAAINALATYLKASGELAPDMQVELWMDGKKLKDITINKDNLFSYDHSLVLSGEELTSGDHKLEIKRKGGGTLYANVYLSCFTLEDHLRAAGLEVKVQRNLYKLVPEDTKDLVAGAHGQALTQKGSRYKREPLPADAKVVSGDLIEVELIAESKNDYEYLMLEDFKPAGCEALNLQSGYVWDQGLNAYREFRDEKVSYYIENLPRGTHSMTYRLRAEIPGQFSALPSVISGMYAPELKGNAEERTVSIADSVK